MATELAQLSTIEWAVMRDGVRLGTLRATHGGRRGRLFWLALGLDKCDLGSFADQTDAFWSVVEDADAGRPRSPRNHAERYRPMYDGPEPVFV